MTLPGQTILGRSYKEWWFVDPTPDEVDKSFDQMKADVGDSFSRRARVQMWLLDRRTNRQHRREARNANWPWTRTVFGRIAAGGLALMAIYAFFSVASYKTTLIVGILWAGFGLIVGLAKLATMDLSIIPKLARRWALEAITLLLVVAIVVALVYSIVALLPKQ